MFGLLVGLVTGFAGYAVTGLSAAFWPLVALGNALWMAFTSDDAKAPPSLQEFRAHKSEYGDPLAIPFGSPKNGDNVIMLMAVREHPIIVTSDIKLLGFIKVGERENVIGYRYFADWGTAIGYADTDGITSFDKVWINGDLYYDVSEDATAEFAALSITRLAENGGTLTFHLGGAAQTTSDVHAAAEGNAAPAYMDLAWIEFTNHEIPNQIPVVQARMVKVGNIEGNSWALRTPTNMEARYSHATALLDNKLYVSGGLNAAGWPTTFWSYSVRDGWQNPAALPAGRDSHTLTPFTDASGKTTLLMAGGARNTGAGVEDITEIKEYDINNNTWSAVPDPAVSPFPMSTHAAAWFISENNGTGIFVLTSSTNPAAPSELWITGNKYASMSQLTSNAGVGAREDLKVIVFNNELYLAGGNLSTGGGDNTSSRGLYKYNDASGGGNFVLQPVTLDSVSYTNNYFPNESESPASGIPDQGIWGFSLWANDTAMLVWGRNSTNQLRIYLTTDGLSFRDITQDYQPQLTGFEDYGGGPAYASFDSVSNFLIVIGGATGIAAAPSAQTWFSKPPTVYADTYRLGGIVDWLCNACGIQPTEIDTGELNDSVAAFAIKQRGEGKSLLAPLQLAYFFDARQSNELEFLKRGNEYRKIINLLETDLGAHAAGRAMVENMMIEYIRKEQIPNSVQVKYFDLNKGQEINLQTVTRANAGTIRTYTLNIPIAMTADQAKRIAAVTLANIIAEQKPTELSLLPKHSLLPSDVIQVPYAGGMYTLRILGAPIGENDLLQLSCASEDLFIYTSDQQGAAGGTEFEPSTVTYDSLGYLLDIAPLIDEHIDTPLAVSVATINAASVTDWAGCRFYLSKDAGASYAFVGSITSTNIIGVCDTALSETNTDYWDRANTLRVTLVNGKIETITEEKVIENNNLAYVGDLTTVHEIINYANVTNVTGSTFDIDTMIRGQYGTQHMAGEHGAGEKFIQLDLNRLGVITLDEGDVNEDLKFKVLSPGQTLDAVAEQDFNWTGLNYKPYAVATIVGYKSPAGAWVVEWSGCTRKESNWSKSLPVPLSEALPAYKVVLYDSLFSTVQATYYITLAVGAYKGRPLLDLSVALQESIFGTAQATLYVEISALNALYQNNEGYGETVKATLSGEGI